MRSGAISGSHRNYRTSLTKQAAISAAIWVLSCDLPTLPADKVAGKLAESCLEQDGGKKIGEETPLERNGLPEHPQTFKDEIDHLRQALDRNEEIARLPRADGYQGYVCT